MRFLRQNTAVILTCGPFYDKTDGVTIENGLTITNERITLTADTDAGSAPTIILDNVTGATTGTANDLNYITNCDAGLMQLELAAADTNRVGRCLLTITDAANHVPVFHELFILPQAIYDWFTGVIVPLPANVTTIAGSAVDTASAQLGVNVVNWKGSVAAAMTGDAYAVVNSGTFGNSAMNTKIDTIQADTDLLDDAVGGLQDIHTDVAAVKSDTAAILADTGTDGVVVAAASKTGYTLTATTGLGNQTANITGNLSGSVGSVTDKANFELSTGSRDAIWDQASVITLSFETLLSRVYQMISNKMNVTDADGVVALRAIGDGSTIATGSVTDNSTTTTRLELTWS
jgi:hypothetical protein